MKVFHHLFLLKWTKSHQPTASSHDECQIIFNWFVEYEYSYVGDHHLGYNNEMNNVFCHQRP